MRGTLWAALVAIGLLLLTLAISVALNWPWNQNFVAIAIFLFLLSVLSHKINLKSQRQKGKEVILPYLTSTVLKLILSTMFLILLVINGGNNIEVLVYVFMIYYATFSTLEIILVNRRNTR